MDAVRLRVAELGAQCNAVELSQQLFSWLVERVVRAAANVLDLPKQLPRPTELRGVRLAAAAAHRELLRAGGAELSEEEQAIDADSWQIMRDVEAAAGDLESLPKLKPDFPKRRPRSPLTACTHAAAVIADAAVRCYAYAPEQIGPLLEQLGEHAVELAEPEA